MTKRQYRSRNDTHRSPFETVGPSRTKSNFKDQCDINNIMAKYRVTGMASHFAARPPMFLDAPSALDYQEALNLTLEAQRAFSTLPAELRARFENRPQALLAFLGDPANRAEAERLGLIKAPEPAPAVAPAPAPVKPSDAPAA